MLLVLEVPVGRAARDSGTGPHRAERHRARSPLVEQFGRGTHEGASGRCSSFSSRHHGTDHLTRPEHLRALVDRIASDPDRRPLRALINNAGIAINAPVEALPLDEWRRQFDVNLFGHIAVTQALLPFLHQSHGRIVNISSVGGKIAMATYGAYAGAKFALEAASDSLRRELAPHGVQVVVEPGAVKTEMADRGAATANDLAERMNPEQQRRYGGLAKAMVAQQAAFTRAGLPADKAGSIIAEAATAR